MQLVLQSLFSVFPSINLKIKIIDDTCEVLKVAEMHLNIDVYGFCSKPQSLQVIFGKVT